MSTTNNVETTGTIRVISFSGKQEDVRMWSRRFEAFVETRGFADALTTKLKNLPPDDEDVDENDATAANSNPRHVNSTVKHTERSCQHVLTKQQVLEL